MIKLANGWTLRLRQEECHDKMIEAFRSGKKEFLVAANCRFGKTVTTLQTLRDYANGDQVIVVLSTMSIKKEWTDGAEATGFDTDLLKYDSINQIDFGALSTTGKHVIYVSTQKLGNGSDKSEDLIRWFNNHSGVKSLVYDECHLGSGTERTQEVLERLAFNNKVYLSGTPYREHLKKEFHMDTVEGEDEIYFYTIADEREDFKAGKITDYTPVQLEMHILDYAKDIDSLVDEDSKEATKYGVSSAYFKKIFSDSAYKSYAEEFLNKIIDFANMKHINTFLFYVPLKAVGNDIVKHFAKEFKNKIEFRNLCGDYSEDDLTDDEQNALDESEARALNEFFAGTSNVIRVGITCNKCGTGTTLRGLDAVAFLKDTAQAIPFIQKSQRVRTPEDGKSVGYCLCFNQWQGLKAFCDYSKAASKDKDESEKDAVKKAIDNGAIKLVLNMTEVKDYTEIIDILNTYKPGQYPLFDDFDFSAWPEDTFTFLNTVEMMKAKLLGKHPELRNDPDFSGASTADELQKASAKHGLENEVQIPTEEQMRQMLEDNFVVVLREFFNFGKTIAEAGDPATYDATEWAIVTTLFGTEAVWNYILKTYPRYVSMVFNYLAKKN